MQRFWLLVSVLLAGASHAALHVSEGFSIEQAASEPAVRFPMFASFDDAGRLFVAESSGLDLYAELQKLSRKCRVSVLEDRDGDGRFETARVFADQLVFPMGLAWRDGQLFVADPPDLIALPDTDGDGVTDRRRVILSGFGHRDNGSLHGLTFGPDGWLYFTMGSPDGYKLRRDDGTFFVGRSGALFRCRADGSGLEVLSRGFENLVEVVFLPGGEIIGTANWFRRPEAGLRDALVHLVEGGLYPLNGEDRGTPYPVTGEPLPALAEFPAVALSGLMRYEGTAFPPADRGQLFSAQHNTRKVQCHTLHRDGSTFRAETDDFVWTDDPDFHPSDVLEDADGSLLIVDTGGWYVQHCPTGKIRDSRAPGGIYRVRAKGAAPVRDGWGKEIRWSDLNPAALTDLLDDSRPVVRERAQRELSQRGASAVPVLRDRLRGSTNSLAVIEALWALASIATPEAGNAIQLGFHHASADVRSVAASVTGMRRDFAAATELVSLLTDSSASVRLAAAQALARCGEAGSLSAMWRALAGEPDRFLEHALIHAAHALADAAALTQALARPEPRVQAAALRLLDQPPRPSGALTVAAVAERISTTNEIVRQAALHVLRRHADWVGPARERIRDGLASARTADDLARWRDLILAFQRDGPVQELIAAVTRDDATSAVRAALVALMAESELAAVPASWTNALAFALAQPSDEVSVAAARTVGILRIASLDASLTRLAVSASASVASRLEALRTLTARQPTVSDDTLDFLSAQLRAPSGPLSQWAALEILSRRRLTGAQLRQCFAALRDVSTPSARKLWSSWDGHGDGATASALLTNLETQLRAGWRPTTNDLTRLLSHFPAELAERVSALRRLARADADPAASKLAEFAPLLTGGNVTRGREVFFSAQAGCATCHALGGAGGRVGPDLTRVGAIRSGRDLLESVLVPSSTFAQNYEPYLAETSDGESLLGTIVRETAGVVWLRDAAGGEVRLPRERLRRLDRVETSLMPEGLEAGLTRDQFRDLMTFLQSLK